MATFLIGELIISGHPVIVSSNGTLRLDSVSSMAWQFGRGQAYSCIEGSKKRD